MGRAGRWLAGGVVVVLVLALLGREAAGWTADFVEWVHGLGALAPVVFVVGFGLSTVALFPSSILTLAAGVLFGVVQGTLYAFLGATLGAACAFLISRHLARRPVERRLAGDPRFLRMDRAIRRNGFQLVFLLRLSPILPFAVVNYALGVTRVRFVDYLVASIGVIPPTWLYVYNGALMGEIAGLGMNPLVGGGPVDYTILALGLLATIALTLLLVRATRRAFR